MQERVRTLMSTLLKKIFKEGRAGEMEELLAELAANGFSQEEIDSALELIFKLAEDEDAAYLRHRVLTPQERHKLTDEASKFLYQVLEQGLLTIEEFELLLLEMTLLRVHQFDREDLEMLLARLIDDPQRLFLTGINLQSAVNNEETIN